MYEKFKNYNSQHISYNKRQVIKYYVIYNIYIYIHIMQNVILPDSRIENVICDHVRANSTSNAMYSSMTHCTIMYIFHN